MLELNWGKVTPEFVKIEKNLFVYVFNHDLSSNVHIDRSIRFIVGRLLFYDQHLPEKAKHEIKLDIRGQNIDQSTIAYIIKMIKTMYNKPSLQNIDVIQ